MKNDHEKYMRLALKEAEKAKDLGEVPVGAVIVDKSGNILSHSHNFVENKQDSTLHAELLAIKNASKSIKNWRLDNCSIYVTLEPCTMCMGAILQSRISKLFFGAYEPRTGAVGSIYNLSNNPKLPYKIKVYPELMLGECSSLLKDFFKTKR